MGAGNPIVSIHDQGAGGNGNVLKEISEPMGALLEVRDILVADPSMSVLEIWGAEYQENNALLLRPESLEAFRALCEREKSPFSVVGKVREERGGEGDGGERDGEERWRERIYFDSKAPVYNMHHVVYVLLLCKVVKSLYFLTRNITIIPSSSFLLLPPPSSSFLLSPSSFLSSSSLTPSPKVTGDGRVILHDATTGETPVDLDLELVLGDMPQKTFTR